MIFFVSVAIVFTLVGIILTLLIEWHYFNSLLCAPTSNDSQQTAAHFPRSKLPKELKDALNKQETSSDFDGCVVLNLFFQFLYKELKDTKKVRRWFMKKLSVEFEELLQKTTIGKLIDQITLKDLMLGTEFPLIKDIKVSNFQLHESKNYIEELDIVMNLEYSGGFQLSINADLVWGRSAYLAVQITRLSGTVRLQLTRQPFTHWSITFCQEPVMDFKVESQFQGRPVPQITSLIISQIRRAIKKKHTLPNYKVRFKPFIEKPTSAVKKVENNKPFEGRLEVSIIECSRLFKTCDEPHYFSTIAVDPLSWSEQSLNDANAWMSIDLEIIKLPLQSLGIVCKQELIPDKGKQSVIIENITADSPASQVDLRKGDVVVVINGAKITSLNQITKILKQSNTKYTIRIERLSSTLLTSRSHESLSRLDEQLLSLNDVETNISAEVMDDFLNLKLNEEKEVPLAAPNRGHVQGSPVKKILLNAHGSIFNKHRGSNSLEVTGDHRRKSEGCEQMSRNIQNIFEEGFNKSDSTKKTSVVKGNPDPIWEEKLVFEADVKQKYLNVGVWCRKHEKTSKDRELKDILVGQVSIFLSDIVNECANNLQGFHQQTFQLQPPELKPTASRFYKLATHPGFDENLCYGDITLVFIHKSQDQWTKVEKMCENVAPILPEIEEVENSTGVCAKESLEARPHEFNGTQFKTGTACHLCGKKIWLKVAFQCKNCGMISHKKCVAKCHSFTMCTNDGAKLLPQAVDLLLQQNVKNPQIITTDAAEDPSNETTEAISDASNMNDSTPTPPGSPKTSRRSMPSLLANLANTAAQAKSGLIRAGSAHNLAPPSHHHTTQSKSLPPSPQYSPFTSRKTSLQGSSLDFDLTDEDVSLTVKKVQSEIDAESINRHELVTCDRETNDPMVKTKLAFQMAKSDERSRALAVLLLHYFAGIQHCHELEDIAASKKQEESSSSIEENSCTLRKNALHSRSDNISNDNLKV
uniref:PDZ domain-containing protein 8 n=1 Tax=Strigamia maritima TaxID=126957 RepID=T1J1P6_STRMM